MFLWKNQKVQMFRWLVFVVYRVLTYKTSVAMLGTDGVFKVEFSAVQ
jgi:hypothetical protein